MTYCDWLQLVGFDYDVKILQMTRRRKINLKKASEKCLLAVGFVFAWMYKMYVY